jgi:predicted nucleic acid-binding protein
MIVVDASLAVKWILWEADSPLAIDFLRRHGRELAAPELIFIEVAGVIVRRGNQDKSLRPDALRALQKWTTAWSDHLVRNVRVTQRRLFNASGMALTIGHPLQDCIYLAVAKEMDAELATCDAKFRDRALALHPRIRLLADYRTPSPSSST